MSNSMPSGGSTPGAAGLAAQETRLARAAASGDGSAFATLYDRYEHRIFNFCHRLLGSGHDAADATQEAFLKVLQRLPKLADRELNFSAYLFTAARNACYDMIGERKKTAPVGAAHELDGDADVPGDLDLDPERTALLASVQDEVRAANGRLPDRQREVLALRELEELSYDEIAEVMGMNQNAVAQLISRARVKLRDELRGSALAAVATSSPECERALPLIAMREDGQLSEGDDRLWLDAHLAVCNTCRLSKETMEEAGVSYRAWLPLVPLAWLRNETIAKAAQMVGADWSGFAGERSGPSEADASAQSAVIPGLSGRRRIMIVALASLVALVLLLAGLAVGGGLSSEPTPRSTTRSAGPGASGASGAARTTGAAASPRASGDSAGDGSAGSEQSSGDQTEPGVGSEGPSLPPSPETPPGDAQATPPADEQTTPPGDKQTTPPETIYE